jgi:hypothetical protein
LNKTINIAIRKKVANQTNKILYICGNSDFVVNFDFDAEWDEFSFKTARFIHSAGYTDVVFEGNQCAVPVISNTHNIKVGVFAGNLRTTTPAYVSAKKSILCESGIPADPPEDVYNQIMDMVNQMFPAVTVEDNGDFMQVIEGRWARSSKQKLVNEISDDVISSEGIKQISQNVNELGEDLDSLNKNVELLDDTMKEMVSSEEFNKTVEQLTDEIIKLRADFEYVAIDITNISSTVTKAEMGNVVNNVTISWVVNKTPKEQTLNGSEVAVNLRSVALTEQGITANKTFTVKVTDERNTTDTATTSITFLNGVYYGAAAAPETLDSVFIRSLTKELSNTRGRTITVNAADGKNIWYALPTRLGACNFSVGGFSGGFDLVDTIQFTNASGYTESYYVYASAKTGLGETKVVVS